ncbi:unnamed protein product [Mytilus coruscus]|uniref:Uncharacterized protein n=1 Tax=Mytilus coruscus TaxID=42192 RepID=A0A6J8A5N3_MYTCO|nr:unnamed protein product [Mytilus coruscus]
MYHLSTAIPGAQYAIVDNFISDINIGRESKCPVCDVIFVFDNEQVIGRSWNNANNKVKMSVITNVVAIEVTENKNLQQNESLTPGKWITSEEKESIIESMCQSDDRQDTNTDFYLDVKQKHYNELHHALDLALQQVCGCLFEKNKRKCSQCPEALIEVKGTKKTNEVKLRNNSTKSTVHEYGFSKPVIEHPQKYSHVESAHNDSPAEICLLDPVFVNPNSIDSIILVLRHIGKKGSISKYMKNDDETKNIFWTFGGIDATGGYEVESIDKAIPGEYSPVIPTPSNIVLSVNEAKENPSTSETLSPSITLGKFQKKELDEAFISGEDAIALDKEKVKNIKKNLGEDKPS